MRRFVTILAYASAAVAVAAIPCAALLESAADCDVTDGARSTAAGAAIAFAALLVARRIAFGGGC